MGKKLCKSNKGKGRNPAVEGRNALNTRVSKIEGQMVD